MEGQDLRSTGFAWKQRQRPWQPQYGQSLEELQEENEQHSRQGQCQRRYYEQRPAQGLPQEYEQRPVQGLWRQQSKQGQWQQRQQSQRATQELPEEYVARPRKGQWQQQPIQEPWQQYEQRPGQRQWHLQPQQRHEPRPRRGQWQQQPIQKQRWQELDQSLLREPQQKRDQGQDAAPPQSGRRSVLRYPPYNIRTDVYDPYGGIPRREDLDEYDTTYPTQRQVNDFDFYPSYRSFRDLVLSTQSLGAVYPTATLTSIKKWSRRAVNFRRDRRYSDPSAIAIEEQQSTQPQDQELNALRDSDDEGQLKR